MASNKKMYRCTIERPDGSTYEQDTESVGFLRRIIGKSYWIVDVRDVTYLYEKKENNE